MIQEKKLFGIKEKQRNANIFRNRQVTTAIFCVMIDTSVDLLWR